jgi:hypothetical protein
VDAVVRFAVVSTAEPAAVGRFAWCIAANVPARGRPRAGEP